MIKKEETVFAVCPKCLNMTKRTYHNDQYSLYLCKKCKEIVILKEPAKQNTKAD